MHNTSSYIISYIRIYIIFLHTLEYGYYYSSSTLASSSMHTMHTTLVVCNIILSLEYNTQCAYYESTSY